MLSESQVAGWVDEHGPLLWHSIQVQYGKAFALETVAAIMADGLRTPAETGDMRSSYTRPDCVYLAAAADHTHGVPVIGVDIRKVPRDRFVMDEDAHLWLSGRLDGVVDEAARHAVKLAAPDDVAADPWAETPDAVFASLRDFGSVAVRGGVDVDAIGINFGEWYRWQAAWDALIPTLNRGSHVRLWLLFPALTVFATGLGFDGHGEQHLRAVAADALRLAARTEGADRAVTVAFGLFHDLMRRTDGDDPGHGDRAAEAAALMHSDGYLALSPEQLSVLMVALAGHALGTVSDDPTVGCCWDGDRLQLRRFGVAPNVNLLSTEAARAILDSPVEQPPSWDDLVSESGLFPDGDTTAVMVPASVLASVLSEEDSTIGSFDEPKQPHRPSKKSSRSRGGRRRKR